MRTLTIKANHGKLDGLVNLLTKGGIFVKYGRWGRPKLRHVHVTADLKHIEWRPLNRQTAPARSSITTLDLMKVILGRDSKKFRRFKKPALEDISFVIQCRKRTLDLEICKDNLIPRLTWVNALQALIDGRLKKEDVVRYVKSRKNTKTK
jgi:hypothetical protein